MVHQIRFIADHGESLFVKGGIIDFRPGVNLLVGDQGSGKTTLLELLRNCGGSRQFSRDVSGIVELQADESRVRSFDFEKDSPRFKDLSLEEDSEVYLNGIKSRLMSHGETVKALLRGLVVKEPTVYLLDEPDMGLSPRSCYMLLHTFKSAVKDKKSQIIASVHNPIVISAFDEVYSLEHKKWMDSELFLKSQKRPRIQKDA